MSQPRCMVVCGQAALRRRLGDALGRLQVMGGDVKVFSASGPDEVRRLLEDPDVGLDVVLVSLDDVDETIALCAELRGKLEPHASIAMHLVGDAGAEHLVRADTLDVDVFDGSDGPETLSYVRAALRAPLRTADGMDLGQLVRIDRAEALATMAAGLAHDAATPIGVARTAVSTLEPLMGELQASMKGDAGVREILGDIHEARELMESNLARAEGLLHSFKALSSGQLSERREEVDITKLLEESIAAMSPELRRTRVNVQIAGPTAPVRWSGVAGHLSQIFVNLLTNCLRYAYPKGQGGEVEVRVAVQGKRVQVEVEDHGVGIPAEMLPKIFDHFVTTGAEVGGTGLGLAICKKLATESLGGTIEARSAPGMGTCVTLRFPL